jgi:hypothetical protein
MHGYSCQQKEANLLERRRAANGVKTRQSYDTERSPQMLRILEWAQVLSWL